MNKAFFDKMREQFGPLKQSQVDGANLIGDAVAALPITHAAYILATAWHETGATLQPIYEKWGPTAAQKKYEGSKSLGNTVKGDGFKLRGRAYVMITGRRNYALFSKLLGVDLLADPDLALMPKNALVILIRGMVEGLFTGKKLADFTNYVSMRKVVNGTDRADLIAGYAEKFEACFAASQQSTTKSPETPVQQSAPGRGDLSSEPAKPSVAPPQPQRGGLLGLFMRLFGKH